MHCTARFQAIGSMTSKDRTVTIRIDSVSPDKGTIAATIVDYTRRDGWYGTGQSVVFRPVSDLDNTWSIGEGEFPQLKIVGRKKVFG